MYEISSGKLKCHHRVWHMEIYWSKRITYLLQWWGQNVKIVEIQPVVHPFSLKALHCLLSYNNSYDHLFTSLSLNLFWLCHLFYFSENTCIIRIGFILSQVAYSFNNQHVLSTFISQLFYNRRLSNALYNLGVYNDG